MLQRVFLKTRVVSVRRLRTTEWSLVSAPQKSTAPCCACSRLPSAHWSKICEKKQIDVTNRWCVLLMRICCASPVLSVLLTIKKNSSLPPAPPPLSCDPTPKAAVSSSSPSSEHFHLPLRLVKSTHFKSSWTFRAGCKAISLKGAGHGWMTCFIFSVFHTQLQGPVPSSSATIPNLFLNITAIHWLTQKHLDYFEEKFHSFFSDVMQFKFFSSSNVKY